MSRERRLRIHALALCSIAGMAAGASAQITAIPQFTGEWFEVVEPHAGFVACAPLRVLGNNADLCTVDANTGASTAGLLASGSWSFSCLISAYSAPRFYGSAGGTAEWTFDQTVSRFGGYFGTNSDAAIANGGGTATFYDEGGNIIGTMPIPITTCAAWEWHGWESTVPVKRIRTASNAFGGAFLDMDDLTADPSGGTGGCYANCDGSTVEPILNVADFGCFLSKFAAGDGYANCDGSTVEPILNVADFGCFLSKFAAGCQ